MYKKEVKVNLKNEKGSIVIFVLAAMMLFLGILFLLYMSNANAISNQNLAIQKIQNQYKIGDMEQRYKRYLKTANISIERGVIATEKSIYKDIDNNIAIIPKGFMVSDVSGEGNINKGLVVKDSSGNEFVWVPVSNVYEIWNEENNTGKLYEFLGNEKYNQIIYSQNNKWFREPGILSDIDYNQSYLNILGLSSIVQLENNLKNEYKEIMTSIKEYEGFYIGRYETGNITQSQVVVQKNNSNISGRSWYELYRKQKEFYNSNSDISSSMITGSTWDMAIKWIDMNNDNKGYIANSNSRGNYSSMSIIATGSNENYKVNNIYDLAGNVAEWTLEADGNKKRTLRGGSAWNAVGVGERSGEEPQRQETYGSRMIMYLK